MSKFKSNNQWLTEALFLETSYADQSRCIYTLKEEDHETKDGKPLLSLKRLYLELADAYEYTFATTYLGSWMHWERLQENQSLNRYFNQWRYELELKLASEGLLAIRDISAEEGAKGLAAAKYLAEKKFLEGPKRGRPSKDEVAGNLKEATREKGDIDQMFEGMEFTPNG